MKTIQAKKLFVLLLFFSSTISPLKIEEITEDNNNPLNSTNINGKSPQPDFRTTPKKMKQSARKTKTEPPVWKKIYTPQTMYFFYQNTRINGLNPSNLEEIFHAITTDTTEKSASTRYYNGNIPLIMPVDKDHLNATKSLKNKTLTDKQNEHSNTQSIRHRLAKLNQELLRSWEPLF